MKTFFVVLKTSSLIIGAIIGAGFVSGRECVIFFNNDHLILSCLITCILFFLGFYIFLSLGRIYKKQTLLNKKLFPKIFKTIKLLSIVNCIICVLCIATVIAPVLAGFDDGKAFSLIFTSDFICGVI